MSADARGGEETRAHLSVRVAGREQPERIEVTHGIEPREELARFLNRQGPYAQLWLRLDSDVYVRYDAIVSISLAEPDGSG